MMNEKNMNFTILFLVFVLPISTAKLVTSKKEEALGNKLKNKVIWKRDMNLLPMVITTWATPSYQEATTAAWETLVKHGNRLEAIVLACSTCESNHSVHSVGAGGAPDERGETTLDALLMDGPGHKMGAVGNLRRIRDASRVAWAVMNYTTHSFLAGESATEFAKSMGFEEQNLTTNYSAEVYRKWLSENCQPNYWKNVIPNPNQTCGPYRPMVSHEFVSINSRCNANASRVQSETHDTIGVIAVDSNGDIAAGTSTSGAGHKIHGRVGDSPIPGAGAYVDNDVGAASATGDGDIMMRFLPSYQAVENMRLGQTPQQATENAIARISRHYQNFKGALIAADKQGRHGAACHGIKTFQYCLFNRSSDKVQLQTVSCV